MNAASEPAPNPDRRRVLGGGLLMFGVLSTGLGIAPAACSAPDSQVARKAMLATLSDLTIPATDTPGALGTGAPAWVALALDHHLRGADWTAVDTVEAALDKQAGSSFRTLDRGAQLKALTAVDAATPPSAPWKVLKSLILRGYYTSEIGASQELRYELTPGRFDPDLPIHPGDRAVSTDQMARMLG